MQVSSTVRVSTAKQVIRHQEWVLQVEYLVAITLTEFLLCPLYNPSWVLYKELPLYQLQLHLGRDSNLHDCNICIMLHTGQAIR